jgi:ABC-type glutathione transport system ATPase component
VSEQGTLLRSQRNFPGELISALSFISLTIADRIAVMKDGRIVAFTSEEEIA